MPVVQFHIVEGTSTPEQEECLLLGAARLYAETLKAPMERVRVFITPHRPGHVCVGGEVVAKGGLHAPYFEFIVLEGRPVEERHRLLAGFTDLLVETLGVRRDLVRGRCRRVEPVDWGIGGEPASRLRQDEIAARAAANAGNT